MRPAPLLLLALLAGCHQAPVVSVRIDTLPGGVRRVMNLAASAWSDSSHIRFTEVQRIQPPEGSPDELGEINDLVMDEHGRLFVTEEAPVRVVAFGVDGHRVQTIGRTGEGPGEYQVAFLAWTGGNLFVHDPGQARTSVFDSAGSFVRSWVSACCMWRPIGSDSLGRAYVPVMAQGPSLDHAPGWIRVRANGAIVDTIWRRVDANVGRFWELKQGNGITRWFIPNQPSLIDIPWVGGGLLVGDNATYSITIAAHGNDSTLVFGRSWAAQQVPEATRRARFDQLVEHNARLKAIAHFEDIPTIAPAFSELAVDAESRIWVHVSVPSDTVNSYWDLFTPEGVWLGTTKAPFRYGRMAFRRHELAVAMTDANELPVIVRYRLEE